MAFDEEKAAPQPPGEAVEEVAEEVKEEISLADEAAKLRKALEEKSAEAERYLDQWRRTAADFANYRKLQERERQQLIETANASLLLSLLPVLDDMDRALAQIPAEFAETDWVEGVKLVVHKMRLILEKAGLQEITLAKGDMFDPYLHEALQREESDEYPEGSILEICQRGYKLGERVLRPALVKVSQGPAQTGASNAS